MPRDKRPGPRLPPALPVTLVSHSEGETEAVGEDLAQRLGAGDVVALFGPLGAGKTCFARGLVRGLGATGRVASPSFTLIREYSGRLPARHIDLYRLEPGDLEDLDWRDLFYGTGVAVVEWAEKAADRLPARRYEVRIALAPASSRDPGERVLSVSAPASAGGVSGSPAAAGATPRVSVHRPAGMPAGSPDRVLAIDTSTRARSLAVLARGEVREVFWGAAEGNLLAEDLAESLEGLLRGSGVRPGELDLVAVATGPGSFTGVKIGLAAAKSLAYALGCALKGVTTLDVLAAAALTPDASRGALVLLDAKRDEVYAAAYLGSPDPLPGVGYVTGRADEVLAGLVGALRSASPGRSIEVVAAGDGAALHRTELEAALADGESPGGAGRLRLAADTVRDPRASDLALLARQRFLSGGGDDPFRLGPLYLREPTAVPGPRGGGRR